MNKNRTTLFALLFLLIFNIHIPIVLAQKPVSEMSEEERNQKIKQEIERFKKEKEKYQHPKVTPILLELEEAYKNGSDEAAKRFQAGETLKDKEGKVITTLEDAKKKGAEAATKEFANKNGINSNGISVTVDIFLKNGVTSDIFDKSRLEAYGCDVEMPAFKSERISASCPIYKIKDIADGIEEINLITPYIPMVVPLSYRSEGLNKVGFSNYSAARINRTGVKAAVIDLGFAGLSSAICHSEQGEES